MVNELQNGCRTAFSLAILLVAPAEAALQMELSGAAQSSLVTVTFSGDSIASSAFSFINIGWEFAPVTFDPFPAAVTGSDLGRFAFTAGSAWLRNDASGLSTALTGVFLQDSSNSLTGRERFGALTQDIYPTKIGDKFEWGGSATFDLVARSLVFGDLRAGTSNAVSGFPFVGQLTIVPIPEMRTSYLLAMGLAPLAFALRRRRPVKGFGSFGVASKMPDQSP